MGKSFSVPIRSVFFPTMHQFTYFFSQPLSISVHIIPLSSWMQIQPCQAVIHGCEVFNHLFWSPNRTVLTEWSSVWKMASDRGWNRTEIANSRTKPTILIVEGRIWALDESLRMNMAISHPPYNNLYGGTTLVQQVAKHINGCMDLLNVHIYAHM